jgi:hypothetical protein
MLPRNIDLTENGDFGGDIFRGGIFLSPEMDIPIELWGVDNMSSEDYNKIIRQKSLFGKRIHTNEKHRIFGITPFVKNLESRCCRCGKELKLPWERKGMELCKQCCDEFEHDNQYLKFPWNNMKLSVIRTDDLFNLR